MIGTCSICEGPERNIWKQITTCEPPLDICIVCSLFAKAATVSITIEESEGG